MRLDWVDMVLRAFVLMGYAGAYIWCMWAGKVELAMLLLVIFYLQDLSTSVNELKRKMK